MISARLIGDDTVLAWLRTTPDAVASGLGRAVTRLGIDLQRRAREAQVARQVRASPFGPPRSDVDLRIEDGNDRIAASVVIDKGADAGARVDVKGSLDRRRGTFRPPASRQAISKPSRRSGLLEQSFLLTAFEEMTGEIRDDVEAELREALTPK